MPATRLNILFERFLAKTCTPAEKQELAELILSKAHEKTVSSLLESAWAATNGEVDMAEDKTDELFQSILAKAPEVPPKPRRIAVLRRWYWAAAAILLCTICLYFLLAPQPAAVPVVAEQHDAPPGTNRATLVLADGSVVTLDSIAKQQLQQGQVLVNQHGGQLTYNVQGRDAIVSFNTLSTPRGGQFRLRLPDGTEVWLNAASSLRYPTAFTGHERLVELTGEAYFDVAKQADRPFRVKTNRETVMEVLGTQFNVNAYPDEALLRTSLVQGSLRVMAGGKPQLLSPGQQVTIDAAGNMQLIAQANIEQAVAWKNGLFNFYKADLPTVMKQLSRWYDVDVVYEGNIPEQRFWGEIQRNLNLSDVLEFLKESGVHFDVEGKKLIVKP